MARGRARGGAGVAPDATCKDGGCGAGPFLLQDVKMLPYVQVRKGNFDSGVEEHVHARRTRV